jgi:TPR repeat protein
MARWHLCAGLLLIAGSCKKAPDPPAGPCDSPPACIAVAEGQLRAPSPGSEAIIVQSLGRACELHSGDACLRLSHYLALHGAERGPVNALLDRACEAGHPGACLTVAEALLLGDRGRTRDLPRARALLEKACSGGEKAACGRLSELRQRPDAGARRQATSP